MEGIMSQQIGMNPNSNIVQIPGFIKEDSKDTFYLVCRNGKKYQIHYEEMMLRELKKHAGNNVFLGGILADDKSYVKLSYLKQDDRFRSHSISSNFAPTSRGDDSPDDEFDPIDDDLPKKAKVRSAS
jgi:hypothetical protein